jgi:hypothetical protein
VVEHRPQIAGQPVRLSVADRRAEVRPLHNHQRAKRQVQALEQVLIVGGLPARDRLL